MNCCQHCFDDAVVKEFIEEHGEESNCDFCQQCDVATVDTAELRELFAPLFDLYEGVERWMLLGDNSWEIGDLLGEAIYHQWGIFSDAVCGKVDEIVIDMCRPLTKDDLLNPLGESPVMYYTDCGWYEAPSEQWKKFVEHITKERRYVLHTAPDEYGFDQLWDPQKWLPAMLEIVAEQKLTGTPIWRSRRHEDPFNVPTIECPPSTAWLGAPPPSAAMAGRANTRGIPVFYGAIEADTARSEVRPAIGQYVWTAEWSLTSDVRVVDLRDVPYPNPFGPYNLRQMIEHTNFLREVSAALALSVAPHEEDIAYVPTQYVVEVMKEEGYGGVMYPSSQKPGGTNVVIFDVTQLDIAEGIMLDKIEGISYAVES